ncbi:hypothetical protein CYFUS_005111 [Cystobacter fuscus]|uniref:Uncharacterized protein n=1 Tax=Cystobacter fuscus TaxID=43 RepID=A0A250J8Z0_9BACT|nr:hypothetical protein [Cystobacter fuscus]ATB39666.1 hypothetical protein CYFUS_005111 [Cystobacter fuscus]
MVVESESVTGGGGVGPVALVRWVGAEGEVGAVGEDGALRAVGVVGEGAVLTFGRLTFNMRALSLVAGRKVCARPLYFLERKRVSMDEKGMSFVLQGAGNTD